MMISNRHFELTVAALPEFVSARATNNPVFILSFSLAIVFALVVLFAFVIVYQHFKSIAATKAQLEQQKQQHEVANAAKEAHERTIAYASHQLR